jgi:hypothetical protein
MSYTQRMADLIQAYKDKFGEGPPIWLVPEDEAVRLMEEALRSGEEIRDEDVTDPDLPPDALT